MDVKDTLKYEFNNTLLAKKCCYEEQTRKHIKVFIFRQPIQNSSSKHFKVGNYNI